MVPWSRSIPPILTISFAFTGSLRSNSWSSWIFGVIFVKLEDTPAAFKITEERFWCYPVPPNCSSESYFPRRSDRWSYGKVAGGNTNTLLCTSTCSYTSHSFQKIPKSIPASPSSSTQCCLVIWCGMCGCRLWNLRNTMKYSYKL